MNACNDKGERHGTWDEYYPNGKLYWKGNYINGKLHGLYELYYSNSELYLKQYYL